MRRAPIAFAIAAALTATLAVPVRARAALLDPSHAQRDAREALREKAFTFCSAPAEPLSPQAVALCPHARETSGCEGFAAACARAIGAAPSSPREHPFLPGLAAFLGALARAVVWILVAGLCLALVVPVARALARMRRGEEVPRDISASQPVRQATLVDIPHSIDEEALLERAAERAGRGDNASALQLYLAASLRALSRRGALRIAADRTNGEYVRGCSDVVAKPALRDIVGEVDRVQFGGEAAGPEAVARAAQRALSIVRSLPIALLATAMAAMFALGCGRPHSSKARREGDDPAGSQLFYEVLHRQGVGVEALGSSLASMPLPKSGDPSAAPPAVVVDVERTALDDETSAHLLEWVEAGGVLVLAGLPHDWPDALHARSVQSDGAHRVEAHALSTREMASGIADDDTEEAREFGVPADAPIVEHAELASGRGLRLDGALTPAVGSFEDRTTYAAVVRRGRGLVLGIATDELLTNVGLLRAGNAAAMIAILSNAKGRSFAVAQPDDGVAPPASPLSALLHAGLGVGLGHGLVATLVLFLAVGVRLARPKPAPPPARRAFAEHIEAVGALYAQTRSAQHALSAYARFVDERLRARMPRHTGDVVAFLASRTGMPLEHCQRLWSRAAAAKAGSPPHSDDLAVLAQLTRAYSTATAQEQ